MSLGLKAIRSCVEHGAVSSFRSIEDDYITEEESPTYDWVKQFVREHRQLPSLDTIQEQGFQLPRRATEPPTHYVQELRKRKLFLHITDRIPEFRSAIEERRLDDAVQNLRDMLAGSNAILSPGTFDQITDLTDEVVEDYFTAKNSPGLRGVTLGYPTLDNLTLGAQPGDLVVIAGRTGMGKSWTLVKMAYEAWLSGHNLGLVSMEMTLLPIARRWIGLHSRINPNLIRAGTLSPAGEHRLIQQAQEIATQAGQHGQNAYLLSGDFSKSVSQVERLVADYEIDILYIDAAYLLTPEGRRQGHVTKWEQIATVIQQLKRIALRYSKPIVLSVQMNRNVKKGTNRTLDTTDIGGSDSIPQDASIICGIRQGEAPNEKTSRIIDLMKNRDGEESSFPIHYKFDPVNLEEAPMTSSTTDVDLSWMQGEEEDEDYEP